MGPWKLWTRGRRPPAAAALGLTTAALAALTVAGCSPAPASTGSANTGSANTGSAQRDAAPAITAPAAREVFDRYVAAAAKATSPKSASSVLSLVTGVERAVLATTLASHSVTVTGASSSTATSAYNSSLTVTPGFSRYTYGLPAFYLPEAAGYPRFFVACATRTLQGTAGGNAATTDAGGAQVPRSGPALLLFSQAGKGDPWLLASISQLPAGSTVPAMARDGSGYIPTVTPSATTLLAQPDYVGALQAGVVDEGPANAATKAVADGPLTTGMYQDAVDHASGMTAPRGDVYQWELQGVNDPEFALRTADGGALVFYTMTLNTTVAVPDVINKANPIHPGPKIPVPVYLQMLLPKGQSAPLEQLQSQQTLSFAAVDPSQGTAKIQVIAIGGGLTSASAS